MGCNLLAAWRLTFKGDTRRWLQCTVCGRSAEDVNALLFLVWYIKSCQALAYQSSRRHEYIPWIGHPFPGRKFTYPFAWMAKILAFELGGLWRRHPSTIGQRWGSVQFLRDAQVNWPQWDFVCLRSVYSVCAKQRGLFQVTRSGGGQCDL